MSDTDNDFLEWLKKLKGGDEGFVFGDLPISLQEAKERIEAIEARDESSVEGLLWRIEELETWKRSVENWFAARAPGADKMERTLGSEGLERSYANLIRKKLDADDARDAGDVVRHFFRNLTHDERVRIFLSVGAVTVYIANDPVYYQEAVTVLKDDAPKVHRLYGEMFKVWSEYEAMIVAGGNITCQCGEMVTVKVQILDKHHPSVREVDGNAELVCLKCGTRMGVWDGYCWVAYRPGWSVKLDGLVKRKDFVVEIDHVCESCERTTRTKRRWSGQWLCDWCNGLEAKKPKGATDCPLSADQAKSILGWIEGADRHEHDDTGKSRSVILPESLALALEQHLRGLYGSR